MGSFKKHVTHKITFFDLLPMSNLICHLSQQTSPLLYHSLKGDKIITKKFVYMTTEAYETRQVDKMTKFLLFGGGNIAISDAQIASWMCSYCYSL